MANDKKVKFDLEERTAIFAESIIIFSKKVIRNSINDPIISQLIRSGTSVGANYCEADSAESRKDFVHKLGICKKEIRESRYWIRLIAKANPDIKGDARELWNEASELFFIFNAIIKKTNNRSS